MGLVFAGVLALPVTVAPAAASAATPEAVELPSQVEVDLELRKGDDTASSHAVVDFDTESKMDVGEDGRQVELKVVRLDDQGAKLRIQLSVVRDGKTLASKSVQASAGKTQKVDLGRGTTLALTLSPKAPKKSHRIEMPEGDDPLSGLE
jgi:hypothetical protein